ncbi:MAG: outer membrane beta-barrel protein, partial [Gammaproteobacteria bacterium]|nr:outer membrane beta-barrel protein [Gammaproteobacteria bacterium]
VVSGTGKRSNYSMNLGSTNVKRNNGDESSGFSGYINWLTDLTVRSKFKANISTDLTDSSSASVSSNIPGVGNGDDVQVTTDVIRNSIASFDYIRDDEPVSSRLWFKYNEITYSDSPLDRLVRAFGLQASYPIARLLSSSVYANYNRTKQLETDRLDERYTIGGNLKYNFSRKLHGFFDLKYRAKESTSVLENYEEVSVFVNLVYGFGGVSRPTRVGGF